MVSVYLANKEILAVVGSANGRSIEKTCAGELPGGALRGGVVVNEEQFAAGLSDFWKKNALPQKNVQLVLGDGRVVLRAVEMPPAKPKETAAMVQQEMADIAAMNAGGNTIADYMSLAAKEGSKNQQLLCAMMDVEVLEPLEQAFSAAGIRLAGITTGQLSVLALLQRMPELPKTFAVLLLDGDNVRVLLIDNGHYKYSGSNRTFGAPGTEELAGELVTVLLSARQLQSADKNAQPLQKIFTVNLGEENFEICTTAIRAAGFECVPLPEMKGVSCAGQTQFLSRWAYPVGALITPAGGRHHVNFLKLQKERAAQKEKESGHGKAILPYALMAGAGILVCLALFVNNGLMQKKIDTANDFLAQETTVAAMQSYDETSAEVSALEGEIAALEQVENALDTYPVFLRGILQKIQQCGGNSISASFAGYDGNSGAVQFSAFSSEVIDIPGYINALEATGLFSSVTYSGYGYQAALQSYTIRVSCQLNAAAGRQG